MECYQGHFILSCGLISQRTTIRTKKTRFFFKNPEGRDTWRAQLIFIAFQLFFGYFSILLNSGRGVGVWSVGDRRWRTLNQSFSRPSLVDCHRVTNQWRPHRNCSASFFVGIRFCPPTARSRVKLPTSSSSSSFYDLFLWFSVVASCHESAMFYPNSSRPVENNGNAVTFHGFYYCKIRSTLMTL